MNINGTIFCRLNLGFPDPKQKGCSERLRIILRYGDEEYYSSGNTGHFENELLEIQKNLPASVYLKLCLICQFAGYHPLGNGLFGCMFCFRKVKSEYINMKSKDEYFPLFNHAICNMQETHLCDEYELRKPKTGYIDDVIIS